MIFLKKKPNGYVFTDLYKKRCFETLRDFTTTESYTELKRHYDSKESIFFVTKKYMDAADEAIINLPYAEELIDVSDDFVSENIFKIAKVIQENSVPYKTYRLFSTASYKVDAKNIEGLVIGYLLNKEQFDALLTAVESADEEELV